MQKNINNNNNQNSVKLLTIVGCNMEGRDYGKGARGTEVNEPSIDQLETELTKYFKALGPNDMPQIFLNAHGASIDHDMMFELKTGVKMSASDFFKAVKQAMGTDSSKPLSIELISCHGGEARKSFLGFKDSILLTYIGKKYSSRPLFILGSRKYQDFDLQANIVKKIANNVENLVNFNITMTNSTGSQIQFQKKLRSGDESPKPYLRCGIRLSELAKIVTKLKGRKPEDVTQIFGERMKSKFDRIIETLYFKNLDFFKAQGYTDLDKAKEVFKREYTIKDVQQKLLFVAAALLDMTEGTVESQDRKQLLGKSPKEGAKIFIEYVRNLTGIDVSKFDKAEVVCDMGPDKGKVIKTADSILLERISKMDGDVLSVLAQIQKLHPDGLDDSLLTFLERASKLGTLDIFSALVSYPDQDIWLKYLKTPADDLFGSSAVFHNLDIEDFVQLIKLHHSGLLPNDCIKPLAKAATLGNGPGKQIISLFLTKEGVRNPEKIEALVSATNLNESRFNALKDKADQLSASKIKALVSATNLNESQFNALKDKADQISASKIKVLALATNLDESRFNALKDKADQLSELQTEALALGSKLSDGCFTKLLSYATTVPMFTPSEIEVVIALGPHGAEEKMKQILQDKPSLALPSNDQK